MRRRWLVASVAAGFFVAAVLVASLILIILPDPQTTAGHAAATTVAAARGSAGSEPSTPLPTSGTAVPSPSTTASPSPPSPPSPPSTPSTSPDATGSAASGPARLAGRIRPGVTYHGVATFYGADGGGNCMYDPSSDLMVAAMNAADYESSKACGAYVQVHASSGATVTVRITDQCPECAVGQLDLSAQAFARLASASAGRVSISWKLLSPGLSASVSVRYKTGSSVYWCAIQAIGHRNPLAQLEIRSGSSWKQLSRSDYNYFVSASGTGCGGSIRITDIYGQRLVINGTGVKPGTAKSTGVQFSQH